MSRSATGMRIKYAANKHEGIVYEGESHSQIELGLIYKGIIEWPDVGIEVFTTECGRFVRREPALHIAPEKLLSEDLK